MEDEIRALLDEELKAQIKQLHALEPGSDARTAAVEDVTKLYRMRNEEDKTIYETYARIKESEDKQSLSDRDVKLQALKIGVEVALFAAEILFVGHWVKRGFQFEENGSFTSTTMRNLGSRFFKFRKGV